MPLHLSIVLFALLLSPGREELAERLANGDRAGRQAAVRALARRGEAEDWKLVLGALADPRGEVAEVAQWEVGRRANEEALQLLLGRAGLRSRSVEVRRRAAEALGRVPLEVRAGRLRDFVGDSDREARRLLLWSIERLARGGRLLEGEGLTERLARVARSGRDEPLRARALMALAQVGGESAEREARRALHARAAGLRRAAVLSLPLALASESVQELLDAVSEDAADVVRLAVVDTLAGLSTRASARSLVERLASEQEERIRHRILRNLREMSGMRYRLDPVPWRAWAAALPADWKKSPVAESPEQSVSFADYRPRSKRLCFLVDLSGSIYGQKSGGRTRKESVDEELAKILERLPADARFNLIPYAGEPVAWRRALVPANRRNVRVASEYFAACNARGAGDLWEALALAMADPDVDTLVVITDGAPTGGAYNRLELLVSLFLERNLTRALCVDSILVDAPRGVGRHWRRLADATAGQSISVRLP